jgi:hypothetical protein
MNFGRMLATALARRIAFVIVTAIFVMLGIGSVRAATKDQALSSCQSALASSAPAGADSKMCKITTQEPDGSFGSYGCRFMYGGSGPFTCGNFDWDSIKNCGASPETIVYNIRPKQALRCIDGCEYIFGEDPTNPKGRIGTTIAGANCSADDYECPPGWEFGTGFYGAGESQICVVKLPECPSDQALIDGECREEPDECPEGKALNQEGECEPNNKQCPAGQIKGPDGSCVKDEESCPLGQVKSDDGTCKKDADGDGEADADDGTFSGGENCDQPPQCSGDAILCGQARIQWRIDCNTRNDSQISGGACGALPVCTGKNCDPQEQAQLLMQWRTSCAIDKLGRNPVTPGVSGDANGNGQPDWTEGTTVAADETGDSSGAKREVDLNLTSFDDSGLGFGRSCPAPPNISVLGANLTLNTAPLCSWMVIGGIFVLILTSIACLRILMGA